MAGVWVVEVEAVVIAEAAGVGGAGAGAVAAAGPGCDLGCTTLSLILVGCGLVHAYCDGRSIMSLRKLPLRVCAESQIGELSSLKSMALSNRSSTSAANSADE